MVDNKSVTLISSYVGLEPTSEVQRYNNKNKEYLHINRPSIIKEYNASMGWVDLLDMMCLLYKRLLKSKRWYLYIFFHTLTITVVNSWFLYRRDCKELSQKHLPLCRFQAILAESLAKRNKADHQQSTLNHHHQRNTKLPNHLSVMSDMTK